MEFELLEEMRSPSGFDIYAKSAVLGYLDGLGPEAIEKVVALLEHVSEYGIPKIETKSGVIVDGLFELKSYQVRIGFVYATDRRRTILLIHGFTKKTDRWPKHEVKTAKRIQAEVLEALSKGIVKYGK